MLRRTTVPGLDRRRYLRTARLASAAVVASEEGYAGTYVVENLSAGGALLVGNHRFGVGDRLRVMFQIGDTLRAALFARVARLDRSRSAGEAFAVEFQEVPLELRETLDQIVWASVGPEEITPFRTLVVHPQANIRAQLERDLSSIGRSVVAFADTTAAASWLEESGEPLTSALVDVDVPGANLLLALVERRAPSAKRILIAEPSGSPAAQAAIAAGPAHALLPRPWGLLGLAHALTPRDAPGAAQEDLVTTRQIRIPPEWKSAD